MVDPEPDHTGLGDRRAQRRPAALPIGRWALGLLYVVAGALGNTIHLVTGTSYATFADAADVTFVRTAWHAVVDPHQVFFIGLLILFEATVGTLVLMGGRAARLGLVGILGMQTCLLLFGWVTTAFAIVMLVACGLLLRAQVHRDRERDGGQPHRDADSGRRRAVGSGTTIRVRHAAGSAIRSGPTTYSSHIRETSDTR